MLERVLVAIDGSEPSQSALAAAGALTASAGSDVVVITIASQGKLLRSVHGPDSLTLQWETPWSARSLVDGAVQRLTDAGVHARGEVYGRFDTIAREILDAARALGAGLIAIGTRGRGRVAASLLGSVAHRVIHLAELPVLATPALPAGTSPSFGRVLLTVDGSAASRRAAEAAAEVAKHTRAEVVVLHVSEPDGPSWEVYREGSVSVERDTPDTSVDLAEGVVRELGGLGVRASATVRASSGNVAGDIVAVATERECGLIALGSRGRGALPSLVLGSTTYQLLHIAACPLLVVR